MRRAGGSAKPRRVRSPIRRTAEHLKLQAPPSDRASKFGTELSELLSARNARNGGTALRSAVRRVNRVEHEPKEREQQARVWMDWDKAATDTKVTLAYGTWRDNFVVVHKPSGVPLMDEEGRDCLEQRISRELEETLGPVQRESRAIIFPHRIDKWVSGLQVVALDHTTAKLLQRSLRRHLWHKRYRALVQLPPGCSPEGQKRMCQSQRCALVNPTLKGALVDHAASTSDELVLHRKGKLQSHISKRLRNNTPSLDDRDQCAQCNKIAPHLQAHPFVIRHLLYRSVPDDFTDPYTGVPPVLSSTVFLHIQTNKELNLALYEAVLHTGKTHQLRLHFSESGLPIVADPYYNAHFIEFLRHPEHPPHTYAHIANVFDMPSKIGLQAFLLELPHPYTNRLINLELPMPSPWRALGFADDRKAPIPENVASPQERFEHFVRDLERDDPARYKPTPETPDRTSTTVPVASAERKPIEAPTRRLFVSNFPTAGMTEEDAAAFFGQYGPIKRMKYLENAVLVDFKTEKAAALFLTQSGKITINGRTLAITRAETTRQRSQQPTLDASN